MKIKKITTLSIIGTSIIMLSGCGSSPQSPNSSDSNNSPNSAITIDKTGVIPVFENSSTKTVVYVHNNSDHEVSGISYSAVTNINNNVPTTNHSNLRTVGANVLIDASKCAIIPAGQSCPIGISTPVITKAVTKGSALLSLKYTDQNSNEETSHVVDFALLDNINNSGVKISGGGLSLTNHQYNKAYGVMYLYGSGIGQKYKVTNLNTNNSAVKITNGNIVSQDIASNFVQAVEISSPISKSSGLMSTLNVSSSENGKVYSSNANIGVMPLPNEAILNAGSLPLIDTAVAQPASSLYVVNSGNSTAEINSIVLPTGVTKATGDNSCGSTIKSGQACTIYFTVSQGSAGNGDIQVNYNNSSSLSANLTWYNGIGGPLLGISAEYDPFVFNATVVESNLITVTNIGGYSMTNITAAAPKVISGDANVSLGQVVNCHDAAGNITESNLLIGGNCTYSINVEDNQTEIGKVKIGVNGNYSNNGTPASYSRSSTFNYNSLRNSAFITITPSPVTMTVLGDGVAVSTQNVVLNNVGNITAAISNSSLSDAPGYLSISQNSCGNSLSANESCVVTLKLGATVSGVNESGVSYLNTTYSGGQALNATASGEIDYHVLNSEQEFTVTSVTSANSSSGNGQNSNTPYIFNGANPTGQSIIFTYENQGTQAIQLTGINDSNSPVSWSLDKTNSTCYSSGILPSGTINIGESCTVIYKNVLYNNAHTGVINLGSSYTENIITPIISFVGLTTNNQYSQQSDLPAPFNGTSVYVTGNQATIANVVSLVNKQLTITNTLTNGAGYSDIMVNSQTESYFINNTPNSSDNCTPTFNASSGTVTQSCTLSSSVESASVSYSVDTNTYAGDSFNVLFSIINDNSQTIGMTPEYVSQHIWDASYAYYANLNGPGYTYCKIDQVTNLLDNCQVESAFGSLSGFQNLGLYISTSNGFAYISNMNTNSYIQCGFDTSSGLLTDCVTTHNSALSAPFASLIVGNYIYFGNLNSTDIAQCNVNAIDGTLSNCSSYVPSGGISMGYIQQMSFNNGYVYMVNINGTGIQCSVGSNGILSDCTSNTFIGEHNGILVNNNFAYVSSLSGSSNLQCQVNSVNGTLSSCANLIDPILTSAVTNQISENNGLVYFNVSTGSNALYINCSIDSSNGSLVNCIQNALPSAISGQIVFN